MISIKYVVDHDYHIHSTISACCRDPQQTTQAILQYGLDNHYRKICLTNHFWDESVPSEVPMNKTESFASLSTALPLPQGENLQFCFGAETDMDKHFTLGISRERFDDFDFVAIPTTHMHLDGFTIDKGITSCEIRARIWEKRLEELLKKDIPWHKVGLAHMTCAHVYNREKMCEVVSNISEEKMYVLFKQCADKGMGIELHASSFVVTDEEMPIILKPYRIAKECGCKFYLGSDSHNIAFMKEAKDKFENIVNLLDLKESDKFDF